MQTQVSSKERQNETRSPWWKRVLWLVIIYGASVLALGVVATLFRMMMTAAGMRSH
ncbi:DUF2474 domain-containing protein [Pantoea allii]|uniref:DUF2474 domain-containing protein n=1 Tax=Pantoea allii TaxID=574096 RepID=UPI0024B6DD6B|nr:DUF2474 domain-containing protein [Pantoea allii]MDJ0040079.1 DUF2474 domain-containing protein [Pantoea allii]MDJ0088043.1 DUF2474 domain-containing protein [Pantoea allii]